jgi:hypothetical protein
LSLALDDPDPDNVPSRAPILEVSFKDRSLPESLDPNGCRVVVIGPREESYLELAEGSPLPVEQDLALVGGGVTSRLTLSASLLDGWRYQKTLVRYYLAEADPDALGYHRIREDDDGGITILEVGAKLVDR